MAKFREVAARTDANAAATGAKAEVATITKEGEVMTALMAAVVAAVVVEVIEALRGDRLRL